MINGIPSIPQSEDAAVSHDGKPASAKVEDRIASIDVQHYPFTAEHLSSTEFEGLELSKTETVASAGTAHSWLPLLPHAEASPLPCSTCASPPPTENGHTPFSNVLHAQRHGSGSKTSCQLSCPLSSPFDEISTENDLSSAEKDGFINEKSSSSLSSDVSHDGDSSDCCSSSDESSDDGSSVEGEEAEEKPAWQIAEEAATPCGACQINPEKLKNSQYKSEVELFYAVGDRGLWSIGNRVVLKQRGTTCGLTQEVDSAKFIGENTTIPAPVIIDDWREGDTEFMLMKRVAGVDLSHVWSDLTKPERRRIAKQTAEYLKQLRGLQSTRMQYLCGRRASLLGNGESIPAIDSISSDDDFWEYIKAQLQSQNLPEKALAKLRERMPPCEPWTFSHSDLTNVNIMVHNGNVSAIIDWEHSGYFPVWWEYVQLQGGFDEEDAAWKRCLCRYMEPHEAASKFWRDVYRLRYRDIDCYTEKANEILENLMA